MLGTGWFHCVKLPHEVVEEDNVLKSLFQGAVPPHVVLATWDAETVVPIDRASARELWDGMERVLRKDYQKRPERAVKNLEKLLIEYDKIDGRLAELERQLADKVADGDERRARKLRGDIAELEQERTELFEDEAEYRDLELRPNPERDELLGENSHEL